MIQVYKIDENGFYTFETYDVEEPNEFEITTPCKTCEDNDFYKPKWTGETWVEGATEEEIREWEEQDKIDICEPTDRERMDQLEGMVGMLAEQVARQSLGM